MKNLNSENQIGGDHYSKLTIGIFNFVRSNFGPIWPVGNVIKYMSRYPATMKIDDLMKARDYIEREIEFRKQNDDESIEA